MLNEWLTTFGEAFGVQVSTARRKIYFHALQGDMTVDELNVACERALKSCRFFPSVAEILCQKVSEEKDGNQLEAERAWDQLQGHIARWGSDGVPLYSGGKVIKRPPLDPATEWATRQCGGIQQVAHLSSTSFPFARRDFISFYQRFKQTDGLQLTVGKAEATKLLQKYAPKLFEAKVEAPSK